MLAQCIHRLCGHRVFASTTRYVATVTMSQEHALSAPTVEELRYLFDLNGYVVVPSVFGEDDLKSANDALDLRKEQLKERIREEIRNTSRDSPLRGDNNKGRMDLGGVLGWRDARDVFRRMLVEPRLRVLYEMLLGTGYRLDHQPFVIAQEKGSEGFHLHGGTIDVESGKFSPQVAYSCRNGTIYNALIGVSLLLADQGPGDGGFCAVRGSHKANFAAPQSMVHGRAFEDNVTQIVGKAGDVIIFSEGTAHGALPWRAEHQRRICLYRFAPPSVAYGRSYLAWPTGTLDGMDDSMRAVLEPPYAVRLDRPIPAVGGVEVVSRSAEKKMFDKEVFDTSYF